MSAKAYDKKTAAFAGFVIQNIPADLTDEEMDGWMENPDATKKFLSRLKPPAAMQQPAPPALVLLKVTELGEIAGKETSACFANEATWYYRDGEIDRWLPPTQPAQSEGVISVYQLQEAMTFRKMAAQAARVPAGASLTRLAAGLKERGHVLTLADVELMVAKQKAGEDVGLRTDSFGNFTFVEDANGSVSVLCFDRSDRGWHANVYRLDDSCRWFAGYRLLLRNSVASTL